MPKVGMVGMGVGNYGIFYGFPWVDVKSPLGAINALIGKFQQWFFWHIGNNRLLANLVLIAQNHAVSKQKLYAFLNTVHFFARGRCCS
jgi:hypothetical protein